jgi:transcriptional regulator with XRE-family HTH domain
MKARAIFAWNLRRLRLERGISQERLAYDAEIDRAYVSELERKRGNATLDLIEKLAKVLDVRMQDFFLESRAGQKPLKALKSGPRKS